MKLSQPPIIIVSGLPRSGTSLMMQMLEAAGFEIASDSLRSPDLSNPRGYFELEKVARLREDTSFLESVVGQAVKVVVPLLAFLPSEYDYCVLFLNRALDEVLASQAAMLDRAAKNPEDRAADPARLAAAYATQIDRAEKWMERHPNVRSLALQHSDLLDAPIEVSKRILEFLTQCGMGSDALARNREATSVAMAECVDPKLYRERRGPGREAQ